MRPEKGGTLDKSLTIPARPPPAVWRGPPSLCGSANSKAPQFSDLENLLDQQMQEIVDWVQNEHELGASELQRFIKSFEPMFVACVALRSEDAGERVRTFYPISKLDFVRVLANSKICAEAEKFDVKRADVSDLRTASPGSAGCSSWSVYWQGALTEQCCYLQLTPLKGAEVYWFPFGLPKVKLLLTQEGGGGGATGNGLGGGV